MYYYRIISNAYYQNATLKYQCQIRDVNGYKGPMLNRSLLNLGLFSRLHEPRLAFSCPSLSALPIKLSSRTRMDTRRDANSFPFRILHTSSRQVLERCRSWCLESALQWWHCSSVLRCRHGCIGVTTLRLLKPVLFPCPAAAVCVRGACKWWCTGTRV